jgi:hypothetical protein
VLHAAPPDPGILELVQNLFVDSITKVLDSGRSGVEDYGGAVVWDLPFGLGVDSDHVGRFPDSFQELLEVPSVTESVREKEMGDDSLSRYRDVVRHLINDIELLNGELINLVEDIDGGNISSIALLVISRGIGE